MTIDQAKKIFFEVNQEFDYTDDQLQIFWETIDKVTIHSDSLFIIEHPDLGAMVYAQKNGDWDEVYANDPFTDLI